ncbi:SusC/RagA family TonB-linked outer membrane protein [Bacteroides sedimenti]|uniref:SusC/RagA family TonB-linked outer membrane protein n=1 Tax=Bacteroides sedimenti TaxID=2136147 RepID=A0ABM8IE77_9BACE
MNLKKYIATFLLLFSVLSLSAQVAEKRINLSFSNITLAEAMTQIEKSSGYTFFYDVNKTNVKQRVTLSAKNTSLKKAIELMLKSTDLDFEVTNSQIALFPKNKKITENTTDKDANIKGTIVDEAGMPIIGANILIEGTKKGTITDIDGNFSLFAQHGSNLRISYIGYQTKTVKASATAIIKLVENTKTLDEVVVVGYGTMKKKDLTGAVNTLKVEQLEKDQPKTIQDMLRTGVAGLAVGMATDSKGNTSMLLRGKGSMSAGTSPLIVLDGVIYPGEITDINPSDIEQIDVLKDASSAAVYGAKASNGVVLITTKKGTRGKKPVINFSATLGVAFKNSLPEVYKGKEYVNYRQAVEESMYPSKPKGYFSDPTALSGSELSTWMDGASGDPTAIWLSRLEMSNIEIENYKAGNVTDWEKLTYNNAALRQDYTVSVAGNKEEMSYYSSLNYIKNENNLKGGGFDAVRARFNLESKAQKYITYGVNAQFTARNEGYISVGGYQSCSPYGNVYDENGKYKLYPNDNLNGYNPLIDAVYTKRINDINNINASMYLKVNLPFGLSVQTTYSPRFEWTNYLNHQSSEHPAWAKDKGNVTREQTKDFFWQSDNMLKWNKEFGKHAFDVTLLANCEKFQRWNNEMTNKLFEPSDNLGYGGIGYGTQPTVNSNDSYRTADAYMGRFHYVYDKRYLITATVRRDGYSAFGMNNPRATFPALALGWVFSEENFFPKNTFVEYGKLRLSWGKNGNRDIGAYEALMRLDPRKYYYCDYLTGDLINVNSFYASNMANPNLKWESVTAYNAGLDFALFNGRLSGSLDVYIKSTSDLLNARILPSITGYTNVISNIGEVQNKGFELSLNSRNIKENNFNWNTSFNLAYNKNTIKHLYGLTEDIKDEAGNVIGQKEADDISKGYFIGRSLDEIWGYKQIGVWQIDEAEEAKKYGQMPGDMKVLDVDGNYKYDNKDKVFQGHTTPQVRWNMRNEFIIFKNISASFSVYSYIGHYASFNRAKNDNALLNVTNQIKTPYWTPDNPTNEYARLKAARPAGIDFNVYSKASFLRFDNISVGYIFPKAWLKNAKIEGLNVNLTMRNVGYIAPSWKGEDPENSGSNTPRIVYFGINLTL